MSQPTIFAGIGLRASASADDVAAALAEAAAVPAALAVPADKADHPALVPHAAQLPLLRIALHMIAVQKTYACNTHAIHRYGGNSAAEAAALAAAGPGARLIQPRRICAEGRVTIALAVPGETP